MIDSVFTRRGNAGLSCKRELSNGEVVPSFVASVC